MLLSTLLVPKKQRLEIQCGLQGHQRQRQKSLHAPELNPLTTDATSPKCTKKQMLIKAVKSNIKFKKIVKLKKNKKNILIKNI